MDTASKKCKLCDHVFAKAPGALRPGQKRCPVCKAAVGSASNKCKPPCGHVFKAAKAKAPGVSKAAKAKATEGGCGRAVDTASKQCKLCDHVFAKAPGALRPGQKRCPVCSAAVASASNECKPSCGHVFKKKGKRPQPGSLCSGAGCGARVLDKDKSCGVCGCVNTAAAFPSRCKGCGQGSRRRMDYCTVCEEEMRACWQDLLEERVVGAFAGGLGPWLPLPSHPLCLQNLRTAKAPSLASQGHLATIENESTSGHAMFASLMFFAPFSSSHARALEEAHASPPLLMIENESVVLHCPTTFPCGNEGTIIHSFICCARPKKKTLIEMHK